VREIPMQPATKPVVPVILARSSEHVHPDVVLAQNKKVKEKQEERKNGTKKRKRKRLERKKCQSQHSCLKRFSMCMTWRRKDSCGR
jgi:TPP-dependent indolepyruvate ferredoxin oxidoreductase alpha subunit